MDKITLFLQKIDFSQYFSDEELADIVKSLEIVALYPGDVIITEGEKGDALYLIQEGRLQVYKAIAPEESQVIAEVGAGKWIGELQVLLGGERMASVRAIEESQLIRFPKTEIIRLNAKYPALNEYFVKIALQNLKELKFTSLLYDFFGHIERSCILELQRSAEWIQLHRGDRLFAQGESGDSVYFLLNGLLNAVIENPPGTICRMASIASGEIIGEMSILTDESRSASIYALRDSLSVRYSYKQFKEILRKYPPLLLKITQRLIERFKQRELGIQSPKALIRRIAVVPHDWKTPAKEFSERLARALSVHGSVLHLNRQHLAEFLEFPESMEFSLESPQGWRFQLWLERQEEEYDFILLEAELEDSYWTQYCLGQCDRILWLARGEGDPALNPIEEGARSRYNPLIKIEQTLVLIHADSVNIPCKTRNWLTPRTLDLHHHIKLHRQSDIDRVARFLANRSIGVAFGGGGARGAGHIGLLQALGESNIPVDFVGGTSIGALIGAQYAMGLEVPEMIRISKEMLVENDPFKSYTIPVISLFDSYKLDRMLQSFYGDVQIEDLWLNFFCVSTNITAGGKVVYRTGPLWKAVRAAIAIPGIFVPLIDKGDLLIDGGGLDNDPSLTMSELNPGPVLLCSVAASSFPKVSFTYESLPSPLKFFWRWLNPWSKAIEFPNLADILVMSMAVNSTNNYESSLAAADLTIAPPLDRYDIFDFKAIDEMVEISYECALEKLEVWSPYKAHAVENDL